MAALSDLARSAPVPGPPARPPRLFPIWEITRWILPVSAEYLRRTLREEPDLPRGGDEGVLRFDAVEIDLLRDHFAAKGQAGRYRPVPRARAPVVTLSAVTGQDLGGVLAHLAVAGALDGWRVLVVDPGGAVGRRLGAGAGQGGLMERCAAVAGGLLRAANRDRARIGARPLPLPEELGLALTGEPEGLARPTRWPGLRVLGDGAGAAVADLDLVRWGREVRLDPATLLEAVLAPWREEVDLVLVLPPPGLGPLALALHLGADLVVLPDAGGEEAAMAAGLLAGVLDRMEAERRDEAEALGLPAEALVRPEALVLPLPGSGIGVGVGVGVGRDALPPMPAPPEDDPPGQGRLWFDVDPRETGRLAYAPPRDALAALWAALVRAPGVA